MTPSLNKDYCVVLYCIISFVWDTNMAAMSIVFCVSCDCVKTRISLAKNAFGRIKKLVANAKIFTRLRNLDL